MRVNLANLVKLHPKQEEALRAVGRYSYILYGGARGGGKTHLAIVLAFIAAVQFPGMTVVIMRRYLDELRRVIIKRFFEIFGALEGRLYRYQKSTRTVFFNNGSTLYFVSADEPEKARKELGAEVQLYIVDEANTFPEDFLVFLKGSLRNTRIPNWKPTLFMTANPGGVADSFFINYFVLPNYGMWTEEELKEKDEYLYIPARVYDNPTILENDPQYVRKLESLPEALRRAWLDGEWGVYEGRFFETFDRSRVVDPFAVPSSWLRWRAIDLGALNHWSVCLWFARSPEGVTYVTDELGVKTTWSEFAAKIVERGDPHLLTYADRHMFVRSVGGEAIQTAQMVFARHGIPVVMANDDREYGWRLVLDGFARGALYIFANCLRLREALERAIVHRTRFDIQRFELDDYLDALRYGIASMPLQKPAPREHEERVPTYVLEIEKRREEWRRMLTEPPAMPREEPRSDEEKFVSPYVWF